VDIEQQQAHVGAAHRVGSRRAAERRSDGRHHGQADAVTPIASTQTLRFAWAGITGLAVGAMCVWRTGLLSALPSATGLTLLAASDFATRRISRRTFKHAAIATFGFALFDAAVQANRSRFVEAAITTAVIALLAYIVWAATSGIAFGDVKLVALATFVPAWLRGTAVITMLLAALATAVVMVVVERVRAGHLSSKSSIAFGPPLLAGWLVGVLTA
jgi:hypothetical protein